MRRGYSIVWGAWQGDLLPGNGRVILDAPVAMRDGKPITGTVRAEFIGQDRGEHLPARRLHLDLQPPGGGRPGGADPPALPVGGRASRCRPPNGASAAYEAGMGLEVFGRDSIVAPSRLHRTCPPASGPAGSTNWSIPPRRRCVLGLGHAAVRDLVSWLRHEPARPIRCAARWTRPMAGAAPDRTGDPRFPVSRLQRRYRRPPGVRRPDAACRRRRAAEHRPLRQPDRARRPAIRGPLQPLRCLPLQPMPRPPTI